MLAPGRRSFLAQNVVKPTPINSGVMFGKVASFGRLTIQADASEPGRPSAQERRFPGPFPIYRSSPRT